MSVRAMTWAFEQPLAGHHKVVLLVLADCFDDERGICFPSVRYIAERAYTSERTVIRVLGDLEAGGYLTRQDRHDSNGRQMSSIYRLQTSISVRQHPPLPEGRVTDCQGGGCQSVREEGDNAVTPKNPKKEGSKASALLLARKEVPASATENRNPSHSNPVNVQTGTVVPLPKKGTRLAEDFEPSPASRAKAAELGLDPATFERELEKFRNYWLSKSGKDATKIDWQRTLQNWLITAAERMPTHAARTADRPNGTQRAEPPGSNLDRIFAKINSAIAAGGAG